MSNDEKSFKELYLMLTPYGKRAMKTDFCLTFDLSESSWKKRYHNMQGMAFSEEERLWAVAYVNKRLEKLAVA